MQRSLYAFYLAITMYPLNYGKISVVPFAIIYKGYFIVMCPLNYVKISVVPFAILIFTLSLQNSGENTVSMATVMCTHHLVRGWNEMTSTIQAD